MAVGDAVQSMERMAVADLGLAPQVLEALQKMGHDASAIRAMTPEERFSEFCEYEGLIGWASALLSAARSCGVVLNSSTYSVIPSKGWPQGDGYTQCPEAEATRWVIYELDGGEAVLVRVEDSRAAADKWVQEQRK